jgi:hypothetical protein
MVSKEEADRTSCMDRQVAESGKPAIFKDQVTLPGGERTILDLKFPISIPGHPDAISGIAIDITEVT